MRKKAVLILLSLLCVIIVIASVVFIVYPSWGHKLPYYMISYGKECIYVPDRVADKYYTDNIALQVWEYHLNDDEMKDALEYVKNHPDVWVPTYGVVPNFVDSVYGKNIGLPDIAHHEVYCYSSDEAYAYFIIDLTDSRYYGIFDSGR